MKLFFFLLFVSNLSFSQKELLLKHQPLIRFNYSDNDNTRIRTYYSDEYGEIKLIINYRENEYFVLSDTLKRDFVLFGNSKVSIDQLQGLQQCDYTGNYDLLGCRLIQNRFFILSFVNTFFTERIKMYFM